LKMINYIIQGIEEIILDLKFLAEFN